MLISIARALALHISRPKEGSLSGINALKAKCNLGTCRFNHGFVVELNTHSNTKFTWVIVEPSSPV